MHEAAHPQNSSPGQAIYDSLLGNGTSLIAAEAAARVLFGLELDPRYCDVIIRHWQAFTGKAATRGADGPTFDEAAATNAGEA